jgi:hypothetical protein
MKFFSVSFVQGFKKHGEKMGKNGIVGTRDNVPKKLASHIVFREVAKW